MVLLHDVVEVLAASYVHFGFSRRSSRNAGDSAYGFRRSRRSASISETGSSFGRMCGGGLRLCIKGSRARFTRANSNRIVPCSHGQSTTRIPVNSMSTPATIATGRWRQTEKEPHDHTRATYSRARCRQATSLGRSALPQMPFRCHPMLPQSTISARKCGR